MTGSALVLRADARNLPLPDASVDLICTSPPYFALRSYTDGGEHYDGQIGAEPTPQEYIANLIDCTREWARVLKPGGSIWVNLGDKYGRGSRTTSDGTTGKRCSGDFRHVATGLDKSLMMLPERYRIAAVDELGLIARAVVVWSKPNGLPESVTDRVRRSHEDWVHLTKAPRYFSAVDEIRETYGDNSHVGRKDGRPSPATAAVQSMRPMGAGPTQLNGDLSARHPLGKLPGSVWEIATEPLKVPDPISHARCCAGMKREGCEDGLDHYAAYPTEWPRRIILGWSPSGICTVCGEGRRPVIASVGLDMTRPQARRAHDLAERAGLTEPHFSALLSVGVSDTGRGAATQTGTGKNTPEVYALANEARNVLSGYAREYLLRRPTAFRDACACTPYREVESREFDHATDEWVTTTTRVPDPTAPLPPTRPAVVVDPFGGTGTTALVAKVLGRIGISFDLSADYCRLAAWRTTDPGQLAKAMRVPPPPRQFAGQLDLFGEVA